jgi:hypothetical protein
MYLSVSQQVLNIIHKSSFVLSTNIYDVLFNCIILIKFVSKGIQKTLHLFIFFANIHSCFLKLILL